MKIRLSLVLFMLFVFAAILAVSVISGYAATTRPHARVCESGHATEIFVARATGELKRKLEGELTR